MPNPIRNLLSTMELGKSQTHHGMTVIPISRPGAKGPDYIPLKEAIQHGKLQITEIVEGGSVPELKVTNGYDCPVLILDGEELIGAKQNRVLNTTVLLKEFSTTVIPVSCTEQGRWSYSRPDFTDAGVIMSPSLRHLKARSVSESLRDKRGHRSDQAGIWRMIGTLTDRAGVKSPTSAMHDIYTARKSTLQQIQKAFSCNAGQVGLLVLYAGKPIGLDFLSIASVFGRLFPELIQSYAMDLLSLDHKGRVRGVNLAAKSFLEEVGSMSYTEHPAVGYGTDYRFTGNNLVGSALEVEDAVVHAAFFADQNNGPLPVYASSRRRREFRKR